MKKSQQIVASYKRSIDIVFLFSFITIRTGDDWFIDVVAGRYFTRNHTVCFINKYFYKLFFVVRWKHAVRRRPSDLNVEAKEIENNL